MRTDSEPLWVLKPGRKGGKGFMRSLSPKLSQSYHNTSAVAILPRGSDKVVGNELCELWCVCVCGGVSYLKNIAKETFCLLNNQNYTVNFIQLM